MKYLTFGNAIFVTITTFIINYFELLPFSQREVSDKYFTLITPANFTFMIWSFIYLGLILLGFLIYKGETKANFKNILLLNIGISGTLIWILFWGFEKVGISLFILFIIFLSLFLNIFLNSGDKLFKYISQFFFGWILAAFVLNIASFLVYKNFLTGNGIGMTIFGISGIIGISVLGIFLGLKKGQIIPAGVLIWGIFGILIQNIGGSKLIFMTSLGSIIILSVFILIKILENSKEKEIS